MMDKEDWGLFYAIVIFLVIGVIIGVDCCAEPSPARAWSLYQEAVERENREYREAFGQ